MKTFTVTFRIALGLAGLAVGVLLSAHALGLIPDERQTVLRSRSHLCESIAISVSTMAKKGDLAAINHSLQAIKRRNHQIVSMGVRSADGRFLVQIGDHAARWKNPAQDRSTETHMFVPVTQGDRRWATVEILFRPIRAAAWWNPLARPLLALGVYVGALSLLLFVLYLRHVLRHLDPSRAVPERVRAALDTLAEGLLVLDARGKIVLANNAFGKTVGRHPDQLLGQSVAQFPWSLCKGEDGGLPGSDGVYPWTEALNRGEPSTGKLIKLAGAENTSFTFVVNATPIRDARGGQRGVLASFEDISDLEEKRLALHAALDKVRASSDHIRRQNAELTRLATRDPLTGCHNRRSFFEQFESQWDSAHRHEYPLSCVIIDIDHFKSVNDMFGHQTGDSVLQKVAEVLQTTARAGDVVCRYGGEEFVVLLPHIDIAEAYQAAERFRQAVQTTPFPNLQLTISLGVSATSQQAADPQSMLEQADKCLYVAKRNGRNQVVRWDRLPEDALDGVNAGDPREPPASLESDEHATVPFQAVTALVSSLAHLDPDTAEHSRRVADLCVATAEGLLSLRDCYLLETAALLHDIGRIGMPRAILNKPGPLTGEEWEVVRRHERMGTDIVEATFGARKLTEVVANFRFFFGGDPKHTDAPQGTEIPLGARILSIADAYDTMLIDRSYRRGRTPRQACDELKRCAGPQFDPELVERFIALIARRKDLREKRVEGVSKKAASTIGRQIERLVTAFDSRDTEQLELVAAQLKATAGRYGVSEIADKASRLEQAVQDDHDAIAILQTANELIDLCRATQRAYLDDITRPAPSANSVPNQPRRSQA